MFAKEFTIGFIRDESAARMRLRDTPLSAYHPPRERGKCWAMFMGPCARGNTGGFPPEAHPYNS